MLFSAQEALDDFLLRSGPFLSGNGGRVKGDTAPQRYNAPLLQPIHFAHCAVGWRQLGLVLVSKVCNNDDDNK